MNWNILYLKTTNTFRKYEFRFKIILYMFEYARTTLMSLKNTHFYVRKVTNLETSGFEESYQIFQNKQTTYT